MVRPIYCPLAKYVSREDRFVYNEAYLRCFYAPLVQESLRRFLSAQKAANDNSAVSAAGLRSQNLEYAVLLLQHDEEAALYFFIFIDFSLLERNNRQLADKIRKSLNSSDDDLTIIDSNSIAEELFGCCESIYGITADEMIKTAALDLEELYQGGQSSDFIIGSNPQIKRITDTIKKIAPFNATVLLTGESGVGKNRFAGMLHSFSERRNSPFITINCGAIPENLLESELFGYEKGAFTGASMKGKAGLIETANHGTLFLDEIGDLPLPMQVKLLKVIQEKKITRVGGIQEKGVDFRLIAATNKDLPGLVESGEFRKDLFYRLNVLSITIPPIRKRKEDIPVFVDYFAAKYNKKYEKNHVFSTKAMERMKKYSWPGNVRELENVVEGVILIADHYVIAEEMLPPGIYYETAMEKYDAEGKTLKRILEEVEREILLEAYEMYGTTTKVAEALGISQASVSIKLNKYTDKRNSRK